MPGVIVKFNDAAEFLAELKANGPGFIVERPEDELYVRVCRLTISRVSRGSVPIRQVYVTATTHQMIDGTDYAKTQPLMGIVQLSVPIGDSFTADSDSATLRRAQEVLATLEKSIKELGFDVRPGVLQWSDAQHHTV